MTIENLYGKYHKALYRYAYRLSRHREISEDLTQDAFFKAIKCQKSVNFAWLKKVVYHLYIKQRETETKSLPENIATENLAGLIERENEAKMRLKRLTPKERRIVEMIAEGKTQKEIGVKLRCSQQNISLQLKHIREKIRKKIKPRHP